VDVFLKGNSFVDYLDRLHDILHQEDGLQLRQNVVQPSVQMSVSRFQEKEKRGEMITLNDNTHPVQGKMITQKW
jgi:hypothetical protein